MTNQPALQFKLEKPSQPFTGAAQIQTISLINKVEHPSKNGYACYFGCANGDPTLKVYGVSFKDLNYFFKVYDQNSNTFYNFCLLDNCGYFLNFSKKQDNTIKQRYFSFANPTRILKLDAEKISATQTSLLTKASSRHSENFNLYLNYVYSNMDADTFNECQQNLESLFRLFAANTIFSFVQKRQVDLTSSSTFVQFLLNRIKAKGEKAGPRTKAAFNKAISRLALPKLEELYAQAVLSIKNASVFENYLDDVSLYTDLLAREKIQKDEIIY